MSSHNSPLASTPPASPRGRDDAAGPTADSREHDSVRPRTRPSLENRSLVETLRARWDRARHSLPSMAAAVSAPLAAAVAGAFLLGILAATWLTRGAAVAPAQLPPEWQAEITVWIAEGYAYGGAADSAAAHLSQLDPAVVAETLATVANNAGDPRLAAAASTLYTLRADEFGDITSWSDTPDSAVAAAARAAQTTAGSSSALAPGDPLAAIDSGGLGVESGTDLGATAGPVAPGESAREGSRLGRVLETRGRSLAVLTLVALALLGVMAFGGEGRTVSPRRRLIDRRATTRRASRSTYEPPINESAGRGGSARPGAAGRGESSTRPGRPGLGRGEGARPGASGRGSDSPLGGGESAHPTGRTEDRQPADPSMSTRGSAEGGRSEISNTPKSARGTGDHPSRHESVRPSDTARHRPGTGGAALGERQDAVTPGGNPTTERLDKPWQPTRLELGAPETVRFIGPNPDFYRTWLIHDGESLVGGAGIRSQGVGSGEYLELWFFERDDRAEAGEAPAVAIAPPASSQDATMRAHLGATHLIPAAPGRTFVMKTASLRLEVELQDVRLREDNRGLTALTVALTPHRAT